MQHLSAYEQWQINKYGKILSRTEEDTVFESGSEEAERFADWVNFKVELEIINHE